MTYGNGDGRWATTTTTGAETTMRGAATTTKAAGSPPPPPPPVTITSGPDPSSQYALCIAISAGGHGGSASPRKKDHVPFLIVAAPPLVVCLRFRLSFASHSLRWLVVASPFVASPSPYVVRRHFLFTQRMAPSPLPLLHRRRAIHPRHRCIAVVPSITPVAS